MQQATRTSARRPSREVGARGARQRPRTLARHAVRRMRGHRGPRVSDVAGSGGGRRRILLVRAQAAQAHSAARRAAVARGGRAAPVPPLDGLSVQAVQGAPRLCSVARQPQRPALATAAYGSARQARTRIPQGRTRPHPPPRRRQGPARRRPPSERTPAVHHRGDHRCPASTCGDAALAAAAVGRRAHAVAHAAARRHRRHGRRRRRAARGGKPIWRSAPSARRRRRSRGRRPCARSTLDVSPRRAADSPAVDV